MGIHDFNTGIPISRVIHHHLKNSHFHPFLQSAHFPDLEESEQFVQAVQHFLDHRVLTEA